MSEEQGLALSGYLKKRQAIHWVQNDVHEQLSIR